MILKNTKSLALMLMIAGTLLAEGEVPLSPYAEKISGGQLSPELEKKITDILKSFNVKMLPHLRKVSQTLFETEPTSRQNVLSKFGCYYIDEDFFSVLSDDELRASLAYTVYAGEAIKRREAQKVRINNFGLGAFFGSSIATSYFLRRKFPQLGIFSRCYYSGLVGSCVVKVAQDIVARMIKNDSYYNDEYIVHKTNDRQGLANLLKKIMISDPIVYDNKLMRNRIARLENNRSTTVK